MVTVDDREGSAQFYPIVRRFGVPCKLGRLAYGDVSFMGSGPGGVPVPVGVEIKSVRDVLRCMCDGRFAGHQLPGLVQSYEQAWLLVEGMWRPRRTDGILEIQSSRGHGSWYEATVGTRRFMYKDLLTWLFTIQIKGGIRLHACLNWEEGAVWLSALYQWWNQDQGGYDRHQSHLALNSSGDIGLRDRALLVRPTLLRRIAAELPGIGWEKSKAIADHFGSPQALVLAEESELATIPGIGKVMAKRIRSALDG